MSVAVVHRIRVFPLSIPLRGRVQHAASDRTVADPIIVEVELTNGTCGFGETLAHPYVTGETAEWVMEAVRHVLAPALLGFHPESFPEALEAIDALPWNDDDDKPISAARAGVELAMLDAAMRHFGRTADDIVQWMGLAGFGSPGCIRQVRFSGVLASDDLSATMRRLRLMYWGGLRDFKLEVGTPGDLERTRCVASYLSRALAKGRATLRVDANGAWSVDQAAEWLAATSDLPIAAVEQPLPRGDERKLIKLRERFSVPFVHDQSLGTEDNARRLIGLGVADFFNIRIGKCGGFLPSLRIAALARRHNVRIQLGCMAGETSILSAAGLRFLEVCPFVSWAEGCFGRFLLRGDIATKGLRFGYGGRPPRHDGAGWGVRVVAERLEEFAAAEAYVIHL
ncbi:MAG: enolase C-terminal domain-like protein [Phycisphaerales bacterium]|nr:enolase C-terminal domain-like protein [Phycisphaerales bacterium]